MPLSLLALATSAMLALFFVVVVLCQHLLGCLGFRALHVAVGSQVASWVLFIGSALCAPFQHRRLTLQSSGTPHWRASPLTFDVRLALLRVSSSVSAQN